MFTFRNRRIIRSSLEIKGGREVERSRLSWNDLTGLGTAVPRNVVEGSKLKWFSQKSIVADNQNTRGSLTVS